MYTSPLIVDGVLYGLSPKLVAFALNAASGEELWRFEPDHKGAPQRGLMWWQKGDSSRLFYTAERHLIALNPSTGQLIEGFGDKGKLDLKPIGETGYLSVTVPGIVFEDLIVLGFSTMESEGAQPGAISAYSAIDGHLVWRFNSIPKPGEPGSETWDEVALEKAGGANNDLGRGAWATVCSHRLCDTGLLRRGTSGRQLVCQQLAGARCSDRPTPLVFSSHAA